MILFKPQWPTRSSPCTHTHVKVGRVCVDAQKTKRILAHPFFLQDISSFKLFFFIGRRLFFRVLRLNLPCKNKTKLGYSHLQLHGSSLDKTHHEDKLTTRLTAPLSKECSPCNFHAKTPSPCHANSRSTQAKTNLWLGHTPPCKYSFMFM